MLRGSRTIGTSLPPVPAVRNSCTSPPVAATVDRGATTKTNPRETLARYTDKPDPLRIRSALDRKGSKFLLRKAEPGHSAEMAMAVNGITTSLIALATTGHYPPAARGGPSRATCPPAPTRHSRLSIP